MVNGAVGAIVSPAAVGLLEDVEAVVFGEDVGAGCVDGEAVGDCAGR